MNNHETARAEVIATGAHEVIDICQTLIKGG